VVEAADEPEGLGDALARLPAGCERLLLKSSGTSRPASLGLEKDRVLTNKYRSQALPLSGARGPARGLCEADAAALVACGIRLVGIDRLSIAAADEEFAVHRRLLAAGIAIVEGLVLEQVLPGAYDLYCLPLLLVGADGAPVRAVLVGR
jgi:kynurenine formamidase